VSYNDVQTVGQIGGSVSPKSTDHLIKRMQSVVNSAARLEFSASRYDRITPLLTQLHWLKVPARIKFKLAVLVYRCLHLQLRCTSLMNSTSHLLLRSTSVSALLRHHRLLSDSPVVKPSAIELFQSLLPDCGTVPLNVKSASSISVFGKRLKINLISHYFPEFL